MAAVATNNLLDLRHLELYLTDTDAQVSSWLLYFKPDKILYNFENSLIILCQILKIYFISGCWKILAAVLFYTHKICPLFTWQCFQGRIRRIPILDGQWHKVRIYGNGIKTNISDPLAGNTGDACEGSKGLPLTANKQIINMDRNAGTYERMFEIFTQNFFEMTIIIAYHIEQCSLTFYWRCSEVA